MDEWTYMSLNISNSNGNSTPKHVLHGETLKKRVKNDNLCYLFWYLYKKKQLGCHKDIPLYLRLFLTVWYGI